MKSTAYQLGYHDGQNGIQPQWRFIGNSLYMQGHVAGAASIYRPKRVWWWPF